MLDIEYGVVNVCNRGGLLDRPAFGVGTFLRCRRSFYIRSLNKSNLKGRRGVMFHSNFSEEKATDVPKRGVFACNFGSDPLSRKKREIAEKLRNREPVVLKPSGELVPQREINAQLDQTVLTIPNATLKCAFYWYERNPKLLEYEKKLVQAFFEGRFQLDKLDDGRLCWEGTMEPCGDDGRKWYLLAVYDNNHPHNNGYGGSVKIYSINPTLEELQVDVGKPIPHVYSDSIGHLYMCTAGPEDIEVGANTTMVTTAATSLCWAAKWTYLVSLWLDGLIGDEIYGHIF
jgi:hypothetical protein